MPLQNEVQPRKPVTLQGMGKITHSRILDPSQDGFNYNLEGDWANRGAVFAQATGFDMSVILFRNNSQIMQSALQDWGKFPGPISPPPTPYDITGTCHSFDNNFWVTGLTGADAPVVQTCVYGSILTFGSGWTNRSGEALAAYPASFPRYMRKARDANFLYYVLSDISGSQNHAIMRCVASAAPAAAFTKISSGPISSNIPEGYGVRDDGQTQLMSLGTGTDWRSTNGGINWSSMSMGTPLATDIVYSKAYHRWSATGTAGPYYSDGDGANGTWVSAKMVGNASTNISPKFNFIEKCDPDGRYLLGVRGYAPIQTFISEDGGKTWLSSQSLLPPYYDTTEIPPNFRLVLVNTGSKILLYQGALPGGDAGAWNFDNSLFESGLIGTAISL